MALGDRNRIVLIESKSQAVGGYGGRTDTWSTFCQVWANVVPIKSRERLEGQAIGNEDTIKFNVRWMSGVTDGIDASMRINYNSKYYQITGVVDIYDKHEEIEITAKVWAG